MTAASVLLASAFAACNCEQIVPSPPPEDAAERYAAAVCDAAARCGCIEDAFAGGVEACKSERMQRFEEIETWSTVEFDLTCFERLLQWLESDQCASVEAYQQEFPPTASACRVFKGTLESGDACTPALYESGGDLLFFGPDNGGLTVGPCKPGRNCYAGTCVDANAQKVAGQGEACHLSLGARCAGEDGFYCARDGVCRARVGIGEPCDTPPACDDHRELYCEGIAPQSEAEGSCSPRIAIGQACDPQSPVNPCADYGYCNGEGVCTEQWGAACYLVAEAPGSYNEADWIPVQE